MAVPERALNLKHLLISWARATNNNPFVYFAIHWDDVARRLSRKENVCDRVLRYIHRSVALQQATLNEGRLLARGIKNIYLVFVTYGWMGGLHEFMCIASVREPTEVTRGYQISHPVCEPSDVVLGITLRLSARAESTLNC